MSILVEFLNVFKLKFQIEDSDSKWIIYGLNGFLSD